jgi:serine/threonine-protein kinase
MRTLGEIKPGQTIGRYEFLIPIAEGGMASVWAARMKGTRGFQKTMAVKMMLSSLSDNPQFEQMFLDEARIASRIHHPNVVEIFDLGEENDVLFIAMEYIDGEPLSTIFRTAQKRQGVPINVALRIISDACAGLHAAHELADEAGVPLGLVHRDVSPQNILVSYDGAVKIVDFGVALAEGRSSDKTSAGTVKGKAPYMSPEQALGKQLDRRTDIFALGIVLYHLTTGRHPFRADNDILTLHNIIENEPPRPSSILPTYPKPLESVVMKALEKSADKRFQTMEEFEVALERAMPPTQARTRSSDVARFVRETVGERGEKRRDALRNAVRLADERLQNELDTAKLAARPVAEIGLTAPTGIVPLSIRNSLHPNSIEQTGLSRVATSPTTALPSFPIGDLGPVSENPSSSLSATSAIGMVASTPPPPPSTAIPLTRPAPPSKLPLLLGAAAIALVAGGVGVFASSSKASSVTPTPAAPTTAAAPPTASTPVEPAATVAATASAETPDPKGSSTPPAVDLDSLPAADKQQPVPVAKGGSGGKRPTTAATTAAPAATPTTPPAPTTKPAGGFNPSTINNPGF